MWIFICVPLHEKFLLNCCIFWNTDFYSCCFDNFIDIHNFGAGVMGHHCKTSQVLKLKNLPQNSVYFLYDHIVGHTINTMILEMRVNRTNWCLDFSSEILLLQELIPKTATESKRTIAWSCYKTFQSLQAGDVCVVDEVLIVVGILHWRIQLEFRKEI